MRYLELLQEFQDTESSSEATPKTAAVDPKVDTKVYYHVTTKARLKSIEASGIEPGRKRRWKTGTGRQLGERGKIYLMSDFHAAVHWANKLQWERYNGKEPDPSPYIIICVRENPKNLAPDPHPENGLYGKSWFEKDGKIDPENIMKIIPLTKELIQSVTESAEFVTEDADDPLADFADLKPQVSAETPALPGHTPGHHYSLRKCMMLLQQRGWTPTQTPNEFKNSEYPEYSIDLDIDSVQDGPFTVWRGNHKLGVTRIPPVAQHMALKDRLI
jgi:hypothetical protein